MSAISEFKKLPRTLNASEKDLQFSILSQIGATPDSFQKCPREPIGFRKDIVPSQKDILWNIYLNAGLGGGGNADAAVLEAMTAPIIRLGNGVYAPYIPTADGDDEYGAALMQAVADASDGQQIHVRGILGRKYNVTGTINKGGLRIYATGNPIIRRENGANEQGIIDDGAADLTATNMVFGMYGDATFEYFNTSAGNKLDSRCGAISTRGAASLFYVECRAISTSTDNNTQGDSEADPPVPPGPTVMAGLCEAGRQIIRVQEGAQSQCRGWCWGWTGGSMDTDCPETTADDYGLWSGVSDGKGAIHWHFSGKHVSTGHSEPIYSTSTEPDCAAWYRINLIESGLKSCVFHGGKHYILDNGKILGGVVCSPENCDTQVYVKSQKLQSIATDDLSNDCELVCHRNDGTGVGLLMLEVDIYDCQGQIKHPDRAMFYLAYGYTFFGPGKIIGYTDNLTYHEGGDDEATSTMWKIGGGADATSRQFEFVGVTFDARDTSQGSISFNNGNGTATFAACKFKSGAGVNDINCTPSATRVLSYSGCIGTGTNGTVKCSAATAREAGVLTNTATLDFTSIGALGSQDKTITVTGAAVGDAVAIGLPAAPAAGIVFFGFVSATNTVTIRGMNITGLGVDPASATYRATVFKTS